MDEREERVVKTAARREHSKTKQEAPTQDAGDQRIQGWNRIAYRRLRDGKRAAGQGEDEEIC